MLPIWDKPTIHYILEELVNAGITDILVLIGRGRECLQNYFDRNFELDCVLQSQRLNPFEHVNINYRRVPMSRGAADNIYHAKSFVGDEPFLVAYSDDIFFGNNASAELIASFNKTNKVTIATCKVPLHDAHNYGVVHKGQIVEKPKSPASNLVSCGRFVLKPAIFEVIENERKKIEEEVYWQKVSGSTANSQVCMTRCLNILGGFKPVKVSAKRFDVGTPFGLFKANQFFAKSLAQNPNVRQRRDELR